MCSRAKNLVIYTMNQAIQKHMADLREQQEILLGLADMLIHLYAIDSTVTRTLQVVRDEGVEATELERAATRLQATRSFQEVREIAEDLLSHLAADDAEKLSAHFDAMDTLAFRPRVDQIGLQRTIADAVSEVEGYPF
ncbi:MAG: hypothetical protein ABEN55_21460 [Bradymonadaceae bacterium]